MKILRTRNALKKWRSLISPKKSVGFVPTMGALHEGHLSLVRRSMRENDLTLVSIFVNPTQFGKNEDFSKYPRTEDEDLRLLKNAHVDAVFLPRSADEVYASSDEVSLKAPTQLSSILDAQFRPGHFDGVVTVVEKLFRWARADRSYFGEKDYQQLVIVQKMVKDLEIPTRIVPVKTFREKSGLAMSSRNRYLSPEHRQAAALIYKVLNSAESPLAARDVLEKNGFEVQYVEVWNKDLSKMSSNTSGRWLVAAKFQGVRLIDNIWRD